MFVLHARQRTIFPRAAAGTASSFRQVRFGHMILTVSADISLSGLFRAGPTSD
jgi:hypothetical protein